MILWETISALRAPIVWRARLGADGKRFFLDPGDGKVEEYSFDVLATPTG
ncbi:MAG TPA: hypothetical protein VML91_27230 [Burkholderiales bacterium]|nr:hypothetical protein [Burkholderiales bacterium]HTQ76234.1 hypothetical protein [Burkholderiales bacterium]